MRWILINYQRLMFKNYDGTEASKNHIHIYKYVISQDAVFDYAYDLDDFPFDENDELVDAVDKFNKYVNLKNRK